MAEQTLHRYPVMLDMTGVACLIVGGGQVATRKALGLLDTGAAIQIMSPSITDTLQGLVEAGQVQWEARAYTPGDVTAYAAQLVFAATDSDEVNRQIAVEAREIGAWVNVVSQSEASNFNNMAVIHRSPITIGLHTGGMSPALTRHLREKVNSVVGEEYVTLSAWLGEMRSDIRQSVSPQAARQHIYDHILDSDVLPLLRQGQTQQARQHLDDIVNRWSQQ